MAIVLGKGLEGKIPVTSFSLREDGKEVFFKKKQKQISESTVSMYDITYINSEKDIEIDGISFVVQEIKNGGKKYAMQPWVEDGKLILSDSLKDQTVGQFKKMEDFVLNAFQKFIKNINKAA